MSPQSVGLDGDGDDHRRRLDAVTATNVSFNGSLGAGASTFGFLGTWNGSNTAPTLTCTAT